MKIACRICGSHNLEPCIDLGDQPWCNNFLTSEQIGTEPSYPLRVVYCHDCHTSQLDFTVKKEIMFGDHTYLSGVTKSLSNHFLSIAKITLDNFFEGSNRSLINVLDIGSNDGTQLKHYKNSGCNVLGVESSKTTATIASQAGINTLNEFFNEQVALRISEKQNIINASGVFFHLEELHSVTRGIKHLLDKDGVFVVQFLYMKSIVENNAFDQIYHEHLLYYTLSTITKLLSIHELSIEDAFLAPIHGGSMICFVRHTDRCKPTKRYKELLAQEEISQINTFSSYLSFSRRIEEFKIRDMDYLYQAKKLGKTIYGFGAPVKGNTLLNYFGIGKDVLDYLVEKNELRDGLFSPGMHIPIKLEKDLTQLPDIYYVLAWNFRDEILANNQELIDNGVEFYFPVNPA
ncbi:class I SAM-dependent methyltransferase [Prochlorococcus sp. MIT 1300]|uniref:class I SAM-dependent methyltransferase n=1 Tax=Prochlorococcus sp. MIT 1300 TaxID=3096218 RepID=UPI002A74D37E|nr:class I SAM-dependent methyltransferase [Prochlorococcus sp. MIT 1300]